MRHITRTDITTEETLDKELIRISKANPTKYVTYYTHFGTVEIFIHDRKPQSLNIAGTEDTYRRHGGFFRNGEIVKPSKTFIAKFNFCPVLG